MITIAELGVIYFMVVAILMRHQIEGIFTSLTTIYKSSKFIQWIFRSQIFFEEGINS